MTYLLGNLRDSGRIEDYETAEKLLSITQAVFNPVNKVVSLEMDAIEIYRRDIVDMLYCDSVALLPNWRKSKTARQMLKIAKWAELEIVKIPEDIVRWENED